MPHVIRYDNAALLLRLFSAVLVCSLRPDHAAAAIRQFIPHYVDVQSEFGIQGIYERDQISGSNIRSRSNSDFLLQEGISVTGLGYIYSPLFVSMATTVGLGLQQEQINRDGERYSYYDGNANNFKQQFKILPSHPYNLELYFLRATPMTSGNAGLSGANVIYEYGARAVYDERPWSTSLIYTNRDMTSVSAIDTETILYNLAYFSSGFNFNGACGQTASSGYEGLTETVNNLYSLGMSKQFEQVRFATSWHLSEGESEQKFEEGVDTNETRQEQFFTELQCDLPYNAGAALTYDKSKMSTEFTRDERTSSLTTDSDRYNFRLHHRLYHSLTSSFGAGYLNTLSGGGEIDQENYRLGLDYAKQIPWGAFLAGVWDSLSYTENQGAPTTLFEMHSIEAARPFFSITYQPEIINRSTIQVYLVDHNDNDRPVFLDEGSHYRVEWIGSYYRITILPAALSALEDQIGDIWDYRYRVDYSFTAADYELQSKSWGSNLQLPLLDKLVTPHYSYVQVDQKVLDGYYPGEPSHSQTHSLGLGFSLAPFMGDITRMWMRSNTSDEDRLIASVGCSRDFTHNTTGSLSLSYEDATTTQYDLAGLEEPISLSEQLYTAQAQVQTVIPEKNLNASLSGNYTLYKGLGESTYISFFSSLVWRVGKLSLDLSASYSTSDAVMPDSDTNQSYTMVRFLIKRQLR